MKRNLLYIFADQWRYQAQGCTHEDQVRTPWMDRFAEESVRFSHAYSTFPLCSPHRASLMTGKYPFNVGMWTNCKTGLEEKIMLKPQETCIGNVLKEHGYQTGYIGKWHLDASEQNFQPRPASGAEGWDAYTPPGERRQGFDYWLSYGACDEHLDPHYWADSEEQIRPGKWSAEFETDKAIEYIGQRKGDEAPFALFLSYNPPHLPYELVPDCYYEQFRNLEIEYRPNVPEALREGILKTQSRQYFAAVAGIDEQFGRIYRYLKEQGMEEDTVVVLSADHGEMLGSHGLMSKNVWYEESIHIPFLIRQSGRLKAGAYENIFASPDHMPTVLGMLGLPVPETCQGYDHSRRILDDVMARGRIAGGGMTGGGADSETSGSAADVPRDMFLCSYPGGAQMVEQFGRLGLTHKAYGWRGIKTHTHTYVVVNGYQPGEPQKEYLYDDIHDPYQMQPGEIGEDCEDGEILAFRRRLRQYLEMTGDPFLFSRRQT